MISEQVNELRYKADIYNTVGSAWELKRAEAKILQRLLRKAADTIEALSAKLAENSGWIPCSERLPTKEESIKNDNRFILDDGNRRYGGLFDYEKQCFVQFDFWKGLVEDKCAIAWQPLPEAYNE